jgi:threonylcarbamoyladenosine tRNA methylthiotransferase MtaB
MKIYLDMVGCRLNQAEIEQMARQFRAQGHEIAESAALADMVVVNTCSVTSEAAADSRQKIRKAARAGAGEVIPTGCWTSLAPTEALALPGVQRIVHNDDKDHLVADLLGLPREEFDLEPLARLSLPGLRQRTRAFIKVQDGCDNACTFCITTLARGASRSRPKSDVLEEIRAAQASGTQEVVLTGVHLGSWGQDFSPALHLRHLIQAILTETDVPRLRLSSLEPWDLDEGFFVLWENPRLMPHLHLPLQSGSDPVLKRMRRKTTPATFRALVEAARSIRPEIAITTDVIAGFPGETDEEFSQTLDFVNGIQFAAGHVFTYSARPGTPAARMKSHLPREIRKRRNAVLRAAFTESGLAYRQQFIGQTVSVLWESARELTEQGWRMEGLSGNYLRVMAITPDARWNRVDAVRLLGLEADSMKGELLF